MHNGRKDTYEGGRPATKNDKWKNNKNETKTYPNISGGKVLLPLFATEP
jgi:hypothetical protein